jgi:hypothetical protein
VWFKVLLTWRLLADLRKFCVICGSDSCVRSVQPQMTQIVADPVAGGNSGNT